MIHGTLPDMPKKSKHVLVMMQPVSDLRLAGITRYAQSHGWFLTVEERFAHGANLWRGDGALVTLRNDTKMLNAVRSLRKRGIPVVDMVVNMPEIRLPRVANDHQAVGRMAAKHFTERNFRQVAWFSTGIGHVHDLRRTALEEAAAGNAAIYNWTYDSRFNWQTFLDWLKAKLSTTILPLGVLAYDESDAARLLNACLDLGYSIPEDVSILAIGNDFRLCERQAIAISDIEQNMERGGFAAAALLDRIMNGGKKPKKDILIRPTGIVLRKSTDLIAASDPRCRAALKFIAGNLSRPFGAQDISHALAIKRNVLDELFRREIKSSVGAEIKRQRIERVKKLLEESDMTLDGIASETGFCNAAYLVATFRKQVGVTPAFWRRRQTCSDKH